MHAAGADNQVFSRWPGVMKKSAPKRKTKKRRHRHGWDEPGKEREMLELRNSVINILNGVLTV